MTRTEMVNAVGNGHAGALNVALHLSDEQLQACIDKGIVGRDLWTRGTADGLLDPMTGDLNVG